MSLNTVLGRSSQSSGQVNTVTTAAPAASTPGAYSQFTSELGDVTQGRVSLLMLNSLILLLVVFYVWTHRAQGGG